MDERVREAALDDEYGPWVGHSLLGERCCEVSARQTILIAVQRAANGIEQPRGVDSELQRRG